MNIHKGCVKVIEESCIGALHRKDRGNDRISKIVDRFRPERELKRKLTTQGITRNQTFISRDHDGNHFILIFFFSYVSYNDQKDSETKIYAVPTTP